MITWTAANTSTTHDISAISIQPGHSLGILKTNAVHGVKSLQNFCSTLRTEILTSGKYQDEQEREATQGEDEEDNTSFKMREVGEAWKI
jgi:hypothetical protein